MERFNLFSLQFSLCKSSLDGVHSSSLLRTSHHYRFAVIAMRRKAAVAMGSLPSPKSFPNGRGGVGKKGSKKINIYSRGFHQTFKLLLKQEALKTCFLDWDTAVMNPTANIHPAPELFIHEYHSYRGCEKSMAWDLLPAQRGMAEVDIAQYQHHAFSALATTSASFFSYLHGCCWKHLKIKPFPQEIPSPALQPLPILGGKCAIWLLWRQHGLLRLGLGRERRRNRCS